MGQQNDAVDDYLKRFGATNGRVVDRLKPVVRIFVVGVEPVIIGSDVWAKFALANDAYTIDQIRHAEGFIHPNIYPAHGVLMNRETMNQILNMSNLEGDRPVFNGRIGSNGYPDMNYISKTQTPFNEQLHNMNTVRIKHVRNAMTYAQQEKLCYKQHADYGFGEEPSSRKIPEVPEEISPSKSYSRPNNTNSGCATNNTNTANNQNRNSDTFDSIDIFGIFGRKQ